MNTGSPTGGVPDVPPATTLPEVDSPVLLPHAASVSGVLLSSSFVVSLLVFQVSVPPEETRPPAPVPDANDFEIGVQEENLKVVVLFPEAFAHSSPDSEVSVAVDEEET